MKRLIKELKELKIDSRRPNKKRMGDIRMAVAIECLVCNDTSKQRINEITRAYLRQLKKDGFWYYHEATERSNARSVNFIIEKLKKSKEWHI